MIVLYNPWSTPSPKKPLPMSLLSVAAMLEGERHYEIVDANLRADAVDHIIDLGRAKKLTCVGMTVMPGPQLNHAVPDSRRLKAALPDVPIVWGGYYPSHHAEVALKDDAVDYCVHGQGERTFVELLSVLENGGDAAAVAGLVHEQDGEVRHNERRRLVPLDELPEWPYHRLEMDRYVHKHYLGDRVGAHHSSFGCPFACNFCAIVEISKQRWVAQSPRRVARVLQHLQRHYGVDAIQFHDMDFFIDEARTAEIAERIEPLGMTWWALGRVDELMRYSDATWRKMKRSGLKMLFCGAESGSDQVLRRMNKGGTATASQTIELARRTKAWGIVPELSFVVGNPPEPAADLDATFGFIRSLKEVNPDAEIVLYAYTPVAMDGTLYADAREAGFTFPETLDEWTSGVWRDFALRRDPRTPWLDMDIRTRMRNFERVLNAYYPTRTDSKLTGFKRAVLRALGAWRYKTEFYGFPIELRAFHKLFGYQRPETTGF